MILVLRSHQQNDQNCSPNPIPVPTPRHCTARLILRSFSTELQPRIVGSLSRRDATIPAKFVETSITDLREGSPTLAQAAVQDSAADARGPSRIHSAVAHRS